MKTRLHGFTLVEMLVVMMIIAILAGLILMGAGHAQKDAARRRASAEIAAMEAALESYKADNGVYPTEISQDARAIAGNPSAAASLELYKALSGDTNANRIIDVGEGKQYMELKPDKLLPSGGVTTPVTALIDPFGTPYGYSTVNKTDSAKGYNPTFDLWSTVGTTRGAETPEVWQQRWVKNW